MWTMPSCTIPGTEDKVKCKVMFIELHNNWLWFVLFFLISLFIIIIIIVEDCLLLMFSLVWSSDPWPVQNVTRGCAVRRSQSVSVWVVIWLSGAAAGWHQYQAEGAPGLLSCQYHQSGHLLRGGVRGGGCAQWSHETLEPGEGRREISINWLIIGLISQHRISTHHSPNLPSLPSLQPGSWYSRSMLVTENK